ncbi:MAG: heparinase II/III-family protein [Treponema sp.]|jgi:hypothetical protein|nr:heparinase II/III-family protein [Treponema sp.]
MKSSEIYPGLLKGAGCGALFAAVSGGKTAKSIQDNALLAPLLERLAQEADAFAQSEISALPFSRYKLFDTTGNRLAYEGRYFERRRRLTVLSLAVWVWKKPEHIAALEDLIWAICDEYSWCQPAHMGGKSLGGMDVRRRLDLFACETGFALAECLSMLDSLLHPAVLNRARDEIMYRVIDSYTSQGALQIWELMDNNWCAVCAGSIASAALYLIADNLHLAGILQRLAPTFERFLDGFSPDGACIEGLSYWTYGVGFYVCFADLLFHRTGGSIDLLHEAGFDRIARFQQHCYFPGGATLNFSDVGHDGKFRLGLSCYLAAHIQGVRIPIPQDLRGRTSAGEIHAAIRLEGYRELIDHCGRCCLALRDLIWAAESLRPPEEDARPAVTLTGAQWLLCSGAGETGFAAKGGHNDEPHNHNDVGSFIFYKKGAMFFMDLGAGEYTKDYFGGKRYEYFCVRSEGHNLPIIGGQGQKPGRAFCAGNCRMTEDGIMSLDLAPAYGIRALERLERCFSFGLAAGALVLKDSFSFAGEAPQVTERFILPAEPRIENGGFTLNLNGTECSLVCSEKITPLVNAVIYRNHEGRDTCVFTADFLFERGGNFSVEFVIR